MSDQNNNYYGQQPYYQQPMYYPQGTVPQGQVPYATAQPVAPQGQMPYMPAQPAVPQGQIPYVPAQSAVPQGQIPYMPAQPAAPQGQMPYAPAQPVAPQGQMPYVPAQPVAQQGQMPYVPAQPAAPQGQIPYMQPQQPYYQPAQPAAPQVTPTAEPEVILQNSMFEGYGFSPDDAADSGHNFGNFMEDNSTVEELSENIFTSTTPNFDISDVEAASKSSSTGEEDLFTSMTPNFDISAVEAAASASASDIDVFSNSVPVQELNMSAEILAEPAAPVEPVVAAPVEPVAAVPVEPVVAAPIEPVAAAPVEPVVAAPVEPVVAAPVEPVAATPAESANAAPAASFNFMAQMQSMFSSMATDAAPAAPAEPVAAPVELSAPISAAEPELTFAPATPIAQEEPVIVPVEPVAPIPVVEQPEMTLPYAAAAPIAQAAPETPAVSYQKPDFVVNGTQSNTIQDISSTTQGAEEKGTEYWAYMDSLLNNFDDGQVHTKAEVSEPAYEVKEEKPRFPFSAGAAAAEPSSAQAAPQETAAPAYDPIAIAASLSAASVAEASPASAQQQYQQASQVQNTPIQPTVTAAADEDKSWLIPEDVNSESSKEDAKAAKQAEKEAARAAREAQKEAEKAAKAEAKAAKKAEKEAAKAAKAQAKAAKNSGESEDMSAAVLADAKSPEESEITKEAKSRKSFKERLASFFPVKGDSVSEIIRKMVLIISAIALIVCGIYLLDVFIDGRTNAKVYNDLSNTLANAEQNEADWSTIYERYPNIQFPKGMQTKFAELYTMNPDLIGWIRIKGLGIDFPVVQTSDDAYYLKHDYLGNSSVYGTVFLSKGNNAKELDLNNVIYGHSMRRDTQMFTALKEYKTIDGFKENPIIEYSTLYENYKFKIYAAFITNGSSAGDVGGYVFDYTFSNLANTSSFAGFINQVNQRKLYTTGVSVKQDDKLITLSTCTYEFDDARLVIIGRLLRDGESEEIDFSKVEKNTNPRYPQAWYDAKSQTNPYANYDQWSPTVSA